MPARRSVMGLVSPTEYSQLQEICARKRCRMSELVGKIVSDYLAGVSAEKVAKAKKRKAKVKKRARR